MQKISEDIWCRKKSKYFKSSRVKLKSTVWINSYYSDWESKKEFEVKELPINTLSGFNIVSKKSITISTRKIMTQIQVEVDEVKEAF